MSEPTKSSDPLHLPLSWADADVASLTEVGEAAVALRSGIPQAWLAAHDAEDVATFDAELWGRLSGHRGHVVLDIPAGMSSVGAATLVAARMGLRSDEVHGDIGGTVSHVVSGVGHRHDQSWHTDSTPWQEPNRYSVLGLVRGAGKDNHSTDLLALTALHATLAADPAACTALQTESIPWRRNFPHLASLHAPVLGPQHPRWVWPVLEELMDGFSPDLQRGVALVARLVNQVPHHSPVVTLSHLLVFDNRRMLHRGPNLEEASGRELVRIKIAGKAI